MIRVSALSLLALSFAFQIEECEAASFPAKAKREAASFSAKAKREAWASQLKQSRPRSRVVS
jgi:hypothetical protein